MGLKYIIGFTIPFFKGLYFSSHKACHSLPSIFKKGHINITKGFQKTEFNKHGTRGVSSFSITSMYLNH